MNVKIQEAKSTTKTQRISIHTHIKFLGLDKEGKPMIEGYATPVIHSDEGDNFFGPGHCGEIFTAADGNEYIFYHCHVRESRRPEQRPMLMSRIKWGKDGWPYVEGGKPE